MYAMRNPIRRYDWGSLDAIPELLGVRPDGQPQAELWMGAHEAGSSQVRIDRRWHDLAAVRRAHGEPRLPFLAKVIAIGAPLSLQIHPASGPDAKIEMLYAWQPCWVLCGFRDVAGVRSLLTDLHRAAGGGELASTLESMLDRAQSRAALRDCLAMLLRAASRRLVPEIRDRMRRLPPWATVTAAIDELAAHHDTDPAVLAPLLLTDVELAPGEAIVCRPGQPHTYLSGVGIEVQSNSDAVLRAGLTSKPVDLEGFLAGLVTDPGPGRATSRWIGAERLLAVDGADFALGVIVDVPDNPIELAPDVEGAQILFCAEGAYAVAAGQTERELRPGQSIFVPGPRTRLIARGKGCLFRVSAGRAG